MTAYRFTDKIPRSSALYYSVLLVWLTTTAMHIPDGYLSPITSAIMFLLVLPFWVSGIRKLRKGMNAQRTADRVAGRILIRHHHVQHSHSRGNNRPRVGRSPGGPHSGPGSRRDRNFHRPHHSGVFLRRRRHPGARRQLL